MMKLYVFSLLVGLLVGVIYALLGVRSPAPPIVALVGLLGILIGEQVPALARKMLGAESTSYAFIADQVKPHMFGEMPRCRQSEDGDAVRERRS
jgi:XapX domain-containing protein